MKRRKKVLIIAICLILILLIALLLNKCTQDNISTNTDVSTTSETVAEKNLNEISIPGYELLELSANSKNQTLCLSNPSQNNCYFQISLFLKNGTLLWKSEFIEPGENSNPIVLTQSLKKGTYTNTVLKYECFKLDGKTPLNSAETKLTLLVK